MSNKPEPPKGYRLLTDEEKTKPLPMDAIMADASDFAWTESCYRGKIVPAYIIGAPNMFYATRTPPQPDSEPRDVATPSEYDRLKAQKDSIVSQQEEKLRDEGRSSVILIRCLNCLTVPQQNRNEFAGAECGGCIAKERDALRQQLAAEQAKVAALEAQLKLPDDYCLSCGGTGGHHEGCSGTTGLIAMQAERDAAQSALAEAKAALERTLHSIGFDPCHITEAIEGLERALNPEARS